MQTIQEYSNRDIDASLMLRRLTAYRNVTTEEAEERLSFLKEKRDDGIRNYKRVDTLDHEIGSLLLLIQNRNQWSDYCCDDVSHWVGAI
jgi:hypothetical protein